MKKALVVIAKQGFQDLELKGTRDGLIRAGFEVVLASTEAGTCIGKFGSEEKAVIAVSKVDVKEYDRVAFIGGPGAAQLADDEACQKLARATLASRKLLGAICIAPTILAKAGVLKGKRATVWDKDGKQSVLLAEHGALYIPEDIVMHGRIVTGSGPEAAEKFGQTFAGLRG